MPSIDDVFGELQQVNTNLNVVHTDLSKVLQALQNVVALDSYGTSALAHLSKQEDTIICSLDKIAQQTCYLLNEAHAQTSMQTIIKEKIATLLALYESVEPAAALDVGRLKNIDKRLDECCPSREPLPVCSYQPCDAPQPLPDPPQLEPPIG